jgi:hypothetical protein
MRQSNHIMDRRTVQFCTGRRRHDRATNRLHIQPARVARPSRDKQALLETAPGWKEMFREPVDGAISHSWVWEGIVNESSRAVRGRCAVIPDPDELPARSSPALLSKPDRPSRRLAFARSLHCVWTGEQTDAHENSAAPRAGFLERVVPCSAGYHSPRTSVETSVVPQVDEDLASACRYEITLPDPLRTVRGVWVIFDRGRDMLRHSLPFRRT